MKTKQIVLTALTIALVAGGAAFAGPGGNGKSNGRGASDNGRNSNGAAASELKWRNAAHASAQAFSNANPNSAVGILATLKNASAAADEALELAGLESGDTVRTVEEIQTLLVLLTEPALSSDEIQALINQA